MAEGRLDPAYLEELFAPLGPVRVRSMFGGQGVYADGLMMALVAYGTLYLKVDAETAPLFEAEGLEPFVFTPPNGKPMAMSYRRMPDDAFDDEATLRLWGGRAMAAARRAALKNPKSEKKSKPKSKPEPKPATPR